jgi:hypothetical protein
MIEFILILTYIAGAIILFDLIIKTNTMFQMKKNNRWCPRNRWIYSSDYNDAVSHSWYKTIQLAESIRQNRKNLTSD